MEYPRFMTVINNVCARIVGVFIIIMGLLVVMEAILRTFFKNPTSWSLDLCTYLLIWTFCVGSAYGFQEKGHVAVDMIVEIIGKKFGIMARRSLALFAYVVSLIVVLVLFNAGLGLARRSIALNKLTFATFQIPEIFLDSAIVFGSALMAATIIFIMLDILKGGKRYVQ
jgi:C4-dicarboxylate transporter DctQ subunit